MERLRHDPRRCLVGKRGEEERRGREERKRGEEESGVREEQDDMNMIMGLINPFHLQLLTSWDLRVVEFDCLHGDGLHWNPRGTNPTCTERKRGIYKPIY